MPTKRSVLVVTLMLLVSLTLLAGCTATTTEPTTDETTEVTTETSITEDVEADAEFSFDSFTEVVDGQYKPQFSEKELRVKKGDLVRINVNVTEGSHDFNIDEFDVHEATPTGEVTTIEFVAGEAGEFEYYCSMPGHRANGHVGTLIVEE